MIASRAEGDDVSTDPHRRLAGKRIIDEQARRQVRTFLDELKNGTQNYRTVASLGGQVAQEYRGRAILEVLQNAHDVLAFAHNDDPRRICFVLKSSPEPELLVANSGRPFRRADFRGLCQLAQSPKDPNESVGNKGLGFQSVLELSTRPEVWSTTPARSDAAFVFGFDPDVHKPIARVARALVNGDPPTDAAFGTEPVVDWSPEQTAEYRQRLSQDRIDPAEEVTKYLSPYVVPRFLDDPPPEVAALLEDGHVTVIRLPLDGGKTGNPDKAIESIREQLKALDEAAMVFLHHLSVLRIDIDDEVVELKRAVDSERADPGSTMRKERLLISRAAPDATEAAERAFRVWSRVVGGDGQQKEADRILDAVRHLPNRWPEVRKVEVAVAVEEAREARKGIFVIFLPTKRSTGVGAHINAPFYGSLDRRQINFDDNYNELLLEFVADLILDATVELVNGDPEPWRGRAVIDLLAQTVGSPTANQTESLTDRLQQKAHDQGRPLDQLACVLCDDGWHRPENVRTMPAIPDDSPIKRKAWRRCAGFTVASSELDERRDAVRGLLRSFGGSPNPTDEEWADTLARLAEHVSQRQVDAGWNDFLRSVLAVLPSKLKSEPRQAEPDPLIDASFLPTEDGRLLSASEDVQIFFRPRRGADDAADFVGSIPAFLKERIAFLHPGVQTHEGPQRRNTEVQKFLDGRFVQSFRREDLLRDVVIPSLPDLPTKHTSPETAACADTLRWTLKMIGQEEQESLLPLLSRLPVACVGGWFAMAEAVFGPGWDGRFGDHLATVADALSHEAADKLLRTALLPPGDTLWGFGAEAGQPENETFDVSIRADLFARAGVAEGLRLEIHKPIRFGMSRSHPELPGEAPSSIPQSAWADWKDAVRGQLDLAYGGWFEYELKRIRLPPVSDLLHRQDIADPVRHAVAELILASLAHWEEGWDEVTIRKREGWSWSGRYISPLKYWLSTLPWLDGGHDSSQRPLRQRWLVPASLLRVQKGRFRHLSPLPAQLAHRLAQEEALLSVLQKLGLNIYPTEDALTGPDLLNALADVATKAPGEMPAGGFDVFLGQVRQAWRYFDPDRQLPEHFLVRTGPRTLTVRSSTELSDVYLPDHSANTRSLREYRRPILAMRPVEANGDVGARLHDELGVRRASALEERCLIDGRLDADRTQGAHGLDATGLGWLPVVLLTLAAHGGNNPRGPATDAWQAAAARLQRIRVRPCHSIAVEFVDGGVTVASSKPPAHWSPQDHILLLNRDVAESRSYEKMASAGQAMLDRQDLLKDLRLVMGSLPRVRQPTRAQIDKALERAEIDAETVEDIRLRWGGTAMLLDRIRPVVKLLGVSDAGLDAAATNTEGLAKWLSERVGQWPSEDLMSAARESYDDFEMGLRARHALGADAELPKWNEALRELGGECLRVENGRAQDQAQRHLDVAARPLRAFAQYVAIAEGEADEDHQAKRFFEINAVHEGLEKDPEWSRLCAKWSRQWWEVPFCAVIDALRERYERIRAAKAHLDAFEGLRGIDDLNTVLERQGANLEPDPLDVARRNQHGLRHVLRSMWELCEAWLTMESVDSDRLPEAPQVPMEPSMYLREWSEAERLDRAKCAIPNRQFLDAVDGCMTIDQMLEKLDIPPDALKRARDKRIRRDREKERKQRTFKVAGKDFVVGGHETYSDLFARLRDLPEPTKSTAVIGARPSGQVGGTGTRGPGGEATRKGPKTVHSSPHLPELVGIVGEMHALRYLQSRFNGVDESAWVSQFKTEVLSSGMEEQDNTSDSLGYDFRFTVDGKTTCVEVKSTTEDGTSFHLSSGELAAANRIANNKDESWCILRVRRALSEQPECDWLPNPFEPGAGQLLRLRQGSMTVEYALSKNTDKDRSAVDTPESEPEDR